jgi:hypothetical protein
MTTTQRVNLVRNAEEHIRALTAVIDAALRAGENEVIAGGVDSPFVFSVFIA